MSTFVNAELANREIIQSPQRLLVFERFAGVCLALMSQTSLRFTDGIGIGEIGLFSAVIFYIITTGTRKQLNSQRIGYALLVLFIVGVSTLYSDMRGVFGISWRDYIAYIWCALVFIVFSDGYVSIKSINSTFSWALLCVIFISSIFFPASAWYYDVRFTGGATNPNQLALFVISAIVINLLVEPSKSWFVRIRNLILLAIGAMTLSDALTGAITIGVIIWLTALLINKIGKLTFVFLVIGSGLAVLLLIDLKHLMDLFGDLWLKLDEGDARIRLLVYGFDAWRASTWSFLFGNGAGAFSGLDGPFDSWETHNTIVDGLAIGGVIPVTLVYSQFFRAAWHCNSKKNFVEMAAIGAFVTFTVFHFAGRHAVFWLVVAVVANQPKFNIVNFNRNDGS